MRSGRVLTLVLLLAAPSGASPAEPPSAPAPRVSVVARVRPGAAADPACLRTAVGGFLAGHGIAVSWPAGPSPAPELDTRRITVDIDLAGRSRAALTFSDSAGGGPLLREVALEHGLDGVGCESLADVIESAVLAMASAAADPPPAPARAVAGVIAAPAAIAPEAVVVRPAPPDAALGGGPFSLRLAYTIEPATWGVPQSGVDLALSFGRLPYRQRFWVRFAYAFPVTVTADRAAVRWQTLTAGSIGFSTASRGRRAWFEAGFWAGLDLAFVEQLAVPGGPAVPSGTDVKPWFTVAWDLSAGVRVAPHAALFAALRFNLGPVVQLEAGGETLFQNWAMFRPALLVGGRWL